ncbi:hypothetical protein GF373_11790 [bacterium]|nr:hypothetical protein [bacterium]
MSGFAVSYGRDDGTSVTTMLKKVAHRGNYLENVSTRGKAILGQNYLRADTHGAAKDATIPVTEGDLSICYDGQINDCRDLCQKFGVSEGPFMEERLVLHLYRKYKTDMFQYLNNAIFAFVITDGETLFAARDVLGIKTLFYAQDGQGLILASELKSIAEITENMFEFPCAHYMDETGKDTRYGAVSPDVTYWEKDVDSMTQEIRDLIDKHIQSTVDFACPTAGLLSGGMDSSVINFIASKLYKQKFGEDKKLKTFSIGVGESGDIQNARLMSAFIDSEHYEIQVTIDDLINALPDVIYYLENFDPSLVRSSVANYLISSYAAKEHGIEVLLSGEGGDEIFCGYTYLKDVPYEEMVKKQIECLGYLHNNASHRLDHMNQCNSVKVVAPLISGELLDYALKIPPQYKQKESGDTRIEKWIFRKAYEGILPQEITDRLKQEFSQGSGSAGVLPEYFENKVSDAEFNEAKAKHPLLRSKEEYYYFKLFTEYFGEASAVGTVGQWVAI